ncbi:MAG: tail protein X [Planctomycetes bacterium]|nr:tail protein X [Planctomycetota bacterium]
MGRLEKVGAAVVGVLLCIIIVVGLANKNSGPETPADASRESAMIKPGQGDPPRADERKPGNQASLEDILNENREKREQEARDKVKDQGDKKDESKVDPVKPGPGGGEVVKDEPKPEPVTGAWPKEYEIKSGDILGRICLKEYGSTRAVADVLAANPGLDPRRLRAGLKIKLPAPKPEMAKAKGETPVAEGGAAAAGGQRPASRWSFITPRHLQANKASGKLVKSDGGRLYTVKSGDTLSGIAMKELGSAKHVQAIVEANKELISSAKTPLQIGWQLELPNLN